MNNVDLLIQNNIIELIKIFIIAIFTIITNLKIINLKIHKIENIIKIFITICIVVAFCLYIGKVSNSTVSVLCLNFIISLTFSNITSNKIGYSILITTVSLCINYMMYTVASIICFIIFKIIDVNSKFIIITFIVAIYIVLMKLIYKIKRFSKGITFLKKNKNNDYFEISILNIIPTLFFTFIIFTNFDIKMMKPIFVYIIIFSILSFITIQKSLQLYYKQKLLKQNLEESKNIIEKKDKIIEEKDRKIEEVEKENLKLHKKIHSINHRQDSLEYKLDTLSQQTEIASEIDIRDRINRISKTITEDKVIIELTKTNVQTIDDMLKYMQSECIKNNIDFELKISGNIRYMTNNYVSKDDLEILIADTVKNAIIAIKHSNNINKSILVRLGIIDGIYSLYVYDTGIEFQINTLLNLGIKPSTTHSDNGGTGMGFMNTFDTINKYKASILIEEIGKESKDNYTKAVIIKFDNNNNYKINSYRAEKIKEKEPKNIIIEKL